MKKRNGPRSSRVQYAFGYKDKLELMDVLVPVGVWALLLVMTVVAVLTE